MNSRWDEDDIPDLEGKTIVVTGANSGLGFEATRMFAENNAEVIMACRDLEKAENAREEIDSGNEDLALEVRELDLASLDSIRSFSDELRQDFDSIDVLCNNAGLMAIPRSETEDGFEMQLGVNHLGHFALTAQLHDLIEEDGRVVTQSSKAHESGEINFDDLMSEESYGKWKAYSQSKLANVLFGYELDRRSDRVDSVVCHPGYSATDLQYKGPEMEGSAVKKLVMKAANIVVAQSARKGALPMVYAAVSDEVRSGEYVGPGGIMEMRGYPEVQDSSERSHDTEVAEKLWTVSEDLTEEEFL